MAEDEVLRIISEALGEKVATQYRLRQAGIGSATVVRILNGTSPVESDSLSKALAAYGMSIRIVTAKKK